MNNKSVASTLFFIACLGTTASLYLVSHFIEGHFGILTYFLYIPGLVMVAMLFAGYGHINTRRDISILLSSIVITLSVVSMYGAFLFGQSLETVTSGVSAVVNENIAQQKSDLGIKETPPIGFSIPSVDFPPHLFQETKRLYSKDSVIVLYEYTESADIKSSIGYLQEPTDPKFIKGIPKNKYTVYEFNYDGMPGVVRELSMTSDNVPNSADHTTFLLLWIKDGKMIIISANNVLKKTITPQVLENMLHKLQVVK